MVFEKQNIKEYKKPPNVKTTHVVCVTLKQQVQQIIQFERIYTTLPWRNKNKLALNPFDDKRAYLNPIQSLPSDKHTQKGDCPSEYCLKLIGLYYEELSTSETDEEIYYNIWTLKEKLNHQQLLKLISDRAHIL